MARWWWWAVVLVEGVVVSSWLPKFGTRGAQLRSAEIAWEPFVKRQRHRICGEQWVRARACCVSGWCVCVCVCGWSCLPALACWLVGEAVVEDAGEAGVDLEK